MSSDLVRESYIVRKINQGGLEREAGACIFSDPEALGQDSLEELQAANYVIRVDVIDVPANSYVHPRVSIHIVNYDDSVANRNRFYLDDSKQPPVFEDIFAGNTYPSLKLYSTSKLIPSYLVNKGYGNGRSVFSRFDEDESWCSYVMPTDTLDEAVLSGMLEHVLDHAKDKLGLFQNLWNIFKTTLDGSIFVSLDSFIADAIGDN